MYLTAEAVEITLAEISRLAPGSRVAFDYLAHEFVHAEAPFEKLGKRAQKSLKKFYPKEIWHYGISIRGDPRENVRGLVEGQGLVLADYEPFGPETEPFGGLALGVVRES